LFQRSLTIREKVLGPEHPAVAQTLYNIANLYSVLLGSIHPVRGMGQLGRRIIGLLECLILNANEPVRNNNAAENLEFVGLAGIYSFRSLQTS
jgi:hypothetical protein